jgi:hypothetical protein
MCAERDREADVTLSEHEATILWSTPVVDLHPGWAATAAIAYGGHSFSGGRVCRDWSAPRAPLSSPEDFCLASPPNSSQDAEPVEHAEHDHLGLTGEPP